MRRIGLVIFLLSLGGCKADESARPRELARSGADPANREPAVTPQAHEASDQPLRCPILDQVGENPIWSVVSRRDEDREGPDAERIGDHCLATDLQFMDAPLFRVRETVGEGAPLIAALPGVERRYDSTAGATVEAHQLVLGSQPVGDYRCVYAISERATMVAGFVPVEHLERVPDPASEPLEELVGYWADEGWDPSTKSECLPNHFSISSDPGAEFALEGKASWCCGCDAYATHIGEVAGRIESCESKAGIVVGNCIVGFVQRGPFVMVWDDMSCGGANVAFRGIYLRSAEPLPEISLRAR